MNIKPILARLQNVIDDQEIVKEMVLLPAPFSSTDVTKSAESVNLVVGYDSSLNSQAALDITLLIAHQTRLATQKQVTVHVVYVADDSQNNQFLGFYNSGHVNSATIANSNLELLPTASTIMCCQPVLDPVRAKLEAAPGTLSTELLEQADKILWQARCLAEEWKGTFVAHLRFGNIADELRKVVEAEAGTLLFLGCHSIEHPMIQQLGDDFPCAVLGIPFKLNLLEECN